MAEPSAYKQMNGRNVFAVFLLLLLFSSGIGKLSSTNGGGTGV
jgi:hypothetical protein